VRDAAVSSPEPGEVLVSILSDEAYDAATATGEALDLIGGNFSIARNASETDTAYRTRILTFVTASGGAGLASQDLLNAVDDRLQADEVRVLTDTVTVEGANIIPVNVTAQVWLYPGTHQAVFTGLEQRLRDAFAAQSGLGWDVTTSWLIAQLHPEGVQRVVLTAPTANVVCSASDAPALGTITLALAGRDR
jgi:phage-related baseplate assembly protein